MSSAEVELCAAFEQPESPPVEDSMDAEAISHVLDVRNRMFPEWMPSYQQHLDALAR